MVVGGDGAVWKPEAVDVGAIVVGEVRVQGSRGAALADAIELLGRGGLELRGLITGRFGLDDALRAIAEAGDAAQLQVVVSIR
jgi:threonine dehydrogenase-like Zn-dependent dehydrogenase